MKVYQLMSNRLYVLWFYGCILGIIGHFDDNVHEWTYQRYKEVGRLAKALQNP